LAPHLISASKDGTIQKPQCAMRLGFLDQLELRFTLPL
jgi:hypothetical protein